MEPSELPFGGQELVCILTRLEFMLHTISLKCNIRNNNILLLCTLVLGRLAPRNNNTATTTTTNNNNNNVIPQLWDNLLP